MRIAVLTNAYPPAVPGGASRIAEQQVNMLRACGHEVRVWHVEVPWFREAAWKRFLHHLKDLKANDTIVKEIIAWNPEKLITHNLTGCGFGTPKAIQHHGVKWVHMLHDVQLFDPSGRLPCALVSTPWQVFWGTLRRFALGRPNVVVSPTRWLLRLHVRRRFFRTTHNIIRRNPGPKSISFPRHLHTPVQILFMGHLTEEKGARVIGQLMKALGYSVHWHIVSDGPMRSALQAIAPSATFYGYLDAPAVQQRMQEADLLLVPSQIEENQPTVILEAAAAGLPVIASNKRGIQETLDGAGYLCPPNRLCCWREAIELLSQENAHQAASARMFALAEKHDPEPYAQWLCSVLKSNR